MSGKTGNPRKRQALKNAMHSRWLRADTVECHYCGVTLTRETATKEHIVPLSRGGADAASNIALACPDCNTRRGSGDYQAFKAHMLPVKQARRAGLPIPQIPVFTPAGGRPRDIAGKANRPPRSPYTKELLMQCLIADRMLCAGHSPAMIAGHLDVPREAVRIMAEVGRSAPGRRIEVAEGARLLELLGKAPAARA